jgi:hypothetical protein
MNIVTVKLKGEDVEIKELTMQQLDVVLSRAGNMTTIDRTFNPDLVTEQMLELCSGLSIEELRSSTGSDLRPLVDAVKEVHPDFLAGIKSLSGGG